MNNPRSGLFIKVVMHAKFHIRYLLGETGLYKGFQESFKLTSLFEVIAQIWLAPLLGCVMHTIGVT